MKRFFHDHEHGPRMGHRFGGRGRFGREMLGPGGAGRARRGDIKFLILAVLADGPRHGYDIIAALEEKSNGRYRPSPGSVYPTLTMLEEGGFITGEQADGKRVFTITDAGRAMLATKPAGAALDDDGEGEGVDLRGAAMKLGAAVMQVARSGDDATKERVRTILDAARKEIYRLLAESE